MASAKWRPFCFGLNVLIDKQAEKLHKKHFVPVYKNLVPVNIWLELLIPIYTFQFMFKFLKMTFIKDFDKWSRLCFRFRKINVNKTW